MWKNQKEMQPGDLFFPSHNNNFNKAKIVVFQQLSRNICGSILTNCSWAFFMCLLHKYILGVYYEGATDFQTICQTSDANNMA